MRDRPSARLIVLDGHDRALMFLFNHDFGPLSGHQNWATPGGKIEAGEDAFTAARRELHEETGFNLPLFGPIGTRAETVRVQNGDRVRATETYIAAFAVTTVVDNSGFDEIERKVMQAHHWWGVAELAATSETYFPENMAELIETARALRP